MIFIHNNLLPEKAFDDISKIESFESRIDIYSGKIIWKMQSNGTCVPFDTYENNPIIFNNNYIWSKSINLLLKYSNADIVIRFDPYNLDMQTVNINNKWGTCFLNNYICVANGTTLTLANNDTGFVEITYDLRNYIKETDKVINIYPTMKYFIVEIEEPSSTNQKGTKKLLRIDPSDQNNPLLIDTSKLSEEELTPLKYNSEKGIPFYYESDKVIYYIDGNTGQKSWWIPKSTGIKKIYIVEERGILAYVEKNGFKGLVCFGH